MNTVNSLVFITTTNKLGVRLRLCLKRFGVLRHKCNWNFCFWSYASCSKGEIPMAFHGYIRRFFLDLIKYVKRGIYYVSIETEESLRWHTHTHILTYTYNTLTHIAWDASMLDTAHPVLRIRSPITIGDTSSSNYRNTSRDCRQNANTYQWPFAYISSMLLRTCYF